MNSKERENCKNATDKLLVLLAGQSNMSGRGYAGPDDLTPIPNLLMIRPDGKWQMAIEPITKDRDFIGTFQASGEKVIGDDPFETVLPVGNQKVCGVGSGRTFGRLLAEANPDRIVGLIPCAVGGTSIAAWMPGGIDDWDSSNYPYDNAIKKAREAQKSGKIIAVLWHQGENDASKKTENYLEKLRTVVQNFRRDLQLGKEVPFIAGDMASFYPESISSHIDIVDHALEVLAAEDPSFRYVHTKDLTHRGDQVHYDTASQHELGRRYFEAYQQFSEKNKR
ncbi:MAG: sialate O-acetylesterase [Lentisphaerae bacterium]|nr:sialate O-acetylesterase [Lentisphaerota bacterium]